MPVVVRGVVEWQNESDVTGLGACEVHDVVQAFLVESVGVARLSVDTVVLATVVQHSVVVVVACEVAVTEKGGNHVVQNASLDAVLVEV